MDFPNIPYEEVYTREELDRIQKEFQRTENDHYLDHAGATLYSASHVQTYKATLLSNIFGNPHSRNPSSSGSTDAIDSIRLRILAHFGTNGDEYGVIFTSGATSACRLVAETFTFNSGPFVYMEESHTSVVGMREVVGTASPCCGSYAIPQSVLTSTLHKPPGNPAENNQIHNSIQQRDPTSVNGLVSFPAQCNFSGSKYPLTWIQALQDGGLNRNGIWKNFCIDAPEGQRSTDKDEWEGNISWNVLLDGAAFVGSNYLDLSKFPCDFVSISFYKMFGFPTGLGALLVRKSSACLLKKSYVGGGTVQVLIPSSRFHVNRTELHQRFEDGTIDFLGILSLASAFDTWLSLGVSLDKISTKTFRLCQYAFKVLSELRHENGQPLAIIYTILPFESKDSSGHILTFNLMDKDGGFIGYSQVEEIAFLQKIHLRYGCFCNPGACRKFLGYEPQDLLQHYKAGHVCGDMRDIVDGKPTGAVRMSVGYMTRKEDVDHFLLLVHATWLNKEVKGHRQDVRRLPLPDLITSPPHLTHILVYPVKSCSPFKVFGRWGLTDGGLQYDRQWLIVTSLGVGLTQKREGRMVLIEPRLDLDNRCLELTARGYPSVSVPLDMENEAGNGSAELCNSKVCGEKVSGVDCGSLVSDWLESVLGHSGLRLMRILGKVGSEKPFGHSQSLANDSQYVLVSQGSLLNLASELANKGTTYSDSESESEEEHKIIKKSSRNLIRRFRPNLVVNWSAPYEEENWNEIQIGQVLFKSGGPCTRCGTICTDQRTGQRSSEPLVTLAARGNPKFGIHLHGTKTGPSSQSISIGDPVLVLNTTTPTKPVPLLKRPQETLRVSRVSGGQKSRVSVSRFQVNLSLIAAID